MRLQRLLRPLVLCFVIVVVLAGTALAFDLRSPQVPFCSGPLQTFLNSIGQGSVHVTTDQVDAQIWKSSYSGNAEFTLVLKQTPAVSSSIGVYNVDDPYPPTLCQVFPAGAPVGSYAALHFAVAGLTVSWFNNLSVYQGSTFYPGINSQKFGFYIVGQMLFLSQDSRNIGAGPQILTFQGSGANIGDWWLCCEDRFYTNPDPYCYSDFNDMVLELQSVVPVPVVGQSWGQLKSLYR